MALLEFVGQSEQDSDNIAASTSRLVNVYREPSGGRTPHVVKSVLGEESFADISDVFLRDLETVNGSIYAACGGNLYRISTGGGVDTLGSITDGETNLSSNNGKVTVAANGDYYVWDGSTLTEPTTGAFSSVGSVTFLGQYTIVTEKDGRRFNWSAVANPSSFDALDFATKEGRDDDVLRALAISGRLWLFGETSLEVWYLTGQASSDAFKRVSGGIIDTGLKSYGLLTEIDQGAFFIGDDNIAYIVAGDQPQPISTRAVETAIAQGDPSRCFFYEDEGHKFCVIRFTDRPAWVFDLATGEWHERARGVDLDPWPAVASAKLGTSWYVGTDLGLVNKLTRNNKDVSDPLRRVMVSNTLYIDGQRFTLAELEVFANMGRSNLGRAAQCWARFSGDSGNTYGREKSRGLGVQGDYDARALWRAQGRFRQVTVELNCSEESDIIFHSQARVRVA